MEKGKSILLSNQCTSFRHNIQELPGLYGGAWKIITRYGCVFNLKYQHGLTYMHQEDPSDNYITDITHVYFGSPGDWNPDNKNDNDDDDLWFDAVSDYKEITDEGFLDSRDGYNLFTKEIKNASEESIISASNIGKQAVDFEGMCRFLAWKPIKTVKRAILATTKYSEKILRLPLRRHYKS